MRIPVLATALCLSALAGCEQSYSTTQTVTESGGVTVERSVEVQIGGDRPAPATAERPATAPAEPGAPAAPDTPVASEG
ncbi:hypothetical protein [Brevundimonas sp. Root1423]|uniref:hypothetical protein n=1 Tax=Brevundimonas sp. Root1423 TaxID=1736462 RepID=UPI000AB437C4|nr:hypothetical protein [Brevundimonas sp. Root1423]